MKQLIPPLLHHILATKRPNKEPQHNFSFIAEILAKLHIFYTPDIWHNLTVFVGENPTTMFTAHTDTVDQVLGTNQLELFNDTAGDMFVAVKDGGILGADCGAGMYVLLKMILAKKPGIYVFFSQEESGRIGSTHYTIPLKSITKCVSFDRKDTNSIITHQMNDRGCSQEFVDYFVENFPLTYNEDPTGSYTDSYSFFETIPECTNISTGVFHEHSKFESLNISFLQDLVSACIEFDWEKLPVNRDPKRLDDSDPYDQIEQFCWTQPNIVAKLLREYGVTITDLEDYLYYETAYENDI